MIIYWMNSYRFRDVAVGVFAGVVADSNPINVVAACVPLSASSVAAGCIPVSSCSVVAVCVPASACSDVVGLCRWARLGGTGGGDEEAPLGGRQGAGLLALYK